jgi:hypothetical protein
MIWALPGKPTHESRTFPTPSLPRIPPEKQYSKKLFFGVTEGGWSIFNMCLELTRGSRCYLQGETVSLASSPWAHVDTRCLNHVEHSQGSHGEVACSWRSPLSVEINSPFVSWFGSLRLLFLEREIWFRGLIWTWAMVGAQKGPCQCGRKDKVIFKCDSLMVIIFYRCLYV